MATPTVLRSRWSDILLAVQAKIVEVSALVADPDGLFALPESRVKIVAMRTLKDSPEFDAPQDVLVWSRGFVNDQAQTEGAGRVDTRFHRRLSLVLRTRNERDESGLATAKLTDATLGLFALEEMLVNTLQVAPLEDSNRNWLTVEPLRVTTGDDPDPDPKQAGWIGSILHFDVCYEPPLIQSINT